MPDTKSSLSNKVIAIPESRQENIMAQLLESRGAQVLRVPMISIHDNPDVGAMLSWMHHFIASPPDVMIILTGEGVRRLLSLADNYEMKQDFVATLEKVSLLCRGPKPNRALREVGVGSDIQADAPTTDGVITTLKGMDVAGLDVVVQLYGEDPNDKLISYLSSVDAKVTTVAPYVYAEKVDEEKVVELILAMARGKVDVIAFTSKPQVKRLLKVAKVKNMTETLESGLMVTKVAAVGPMVEEQLLMEGISVDIMPERAFFMKPLVSAIMKYFAH